MIRLYAYLRVYVHIVRPHIYTHDAHLQTPITQVMEYVGVVKLKAGKKYTSKSKIVPGSGRSSRDHADEMGGGLGGGDEMEEETEEKREEEMEEETEKRDKQKKLEKRQPPVRKGRMKDTPKDAPSSTRGKGGGGREIEKGVVSKGATMTEEEIGKYMIGTVFNACVRVCVCVCHCACVCDVCQFGSVPRCNLSP